MQNSKKAWEKAFFIFSLGLNLCPPDCQGPRCLWRKFQRRVSSQIWSFKKEERTSLQKSYFAKLKNGFLHIRTLGTKPLCCNFHLHHTFPPAQKIELAILYCCCCCKLSNCCNLPPSNLSKEKKIISTYHKHGFVTVFVGLAGYQPFCGYFLQLILLLLLPPHSSLFFFYFFFFFSLILDTTRSS